MEDLILHSISNIGVPAVICLYTLFEVKKAVDNLTDAVKNLSHNIFSQTADFKELRNEIKVLRDDVSEIKLRLK